MIIRSVFSKYDADGTGSLETSEVHSMLYELGYFLTPTQLSDVLRQIDVNGDGHVLYNEFLAWWRRADKFRDLDAAEMARRKQASQYFSFFDKDKSGQLDRTEFKALYADLVKRHLTTLTEQQALAKLDSNHNGKISFNEFADFANGGYS
ncbi:calcium-dependent protein kinase 21 [Pelomyxa schiedti]|nr:calcium-dependent protein kinase 21 [Pelomyxa schiedti]